MVNSFASAWIEAAKDLGIRVVHPYTFITKNGVEATTQGVYLPDFGSPHGTLLTCRFDADEIDDAADESNAYRSHLNPNSYEPYRRELYVETLNDWGWFGASSPPIWYTGNPWTE